MKQTTSRANAFTLVEMLVAIAVLSILLAVVFVPLRLAINSYHVGQAQTSTQNAAQATLDDMERDFRRAVYVFPNTALANVTNKAPYPNNFIPGANVGDPVTPYPYTKAIDPTDNSNSATGTSSNPAFSAQKGVCGRAGTLAAIPWKNTSRVDMILAKRDSVTGKVLFPLQPGDTVVTYYARRQRVGADAPYNPSDNPIVLFRAEMPYRDATTGNAIPSGAAGSPNVDVSSQRLGYLNDSSACGSTNAPSTTFRGSLWLAHNANGEANLEPMVDARNGVQTVAIPRGVGLVASQAYKVDPTNPNYNPTAIDYTKEAPLVPDTSFQLSDTNGDGKIDQVAVSLALETFDSNQGANVNSNGQPKGQIVRARRVFDLPNVR